MHPDRRQGRILAMQALCQWDVQGDASAEALEGVFQPEGTTRRAAGYAEKLARSFWSQRKRVDKHLSTASSRWDLSRVSPVERNVMRVAVVELIGTEIPPKVAVNEAIEIAREFGGADSPRFVNGVLDEVLKDLASRGL